VGARIVKHGVPIHPGTLFWIAYVGAVPLCGLSSCEMFSQRTILDLVLPRLFAGEPIGKDHLARLRHGGMLGREMAFRFPSYNTRDEPDAGSPAVPAE
jgi:molybdopterin biosynthesis enzyme